MGKSRNSIR